MVSQFINGSMSKPTHVLDNCRKF